MYMTEEIGILADLDPKLDIQEDSSSAYDFLSERAIIPRVGSYLGLDISETSSGICIYRDGEKILANASLITPESEEYREVKLRRELKGYFLELFSGWSFDVIIVEDAFQGPNPKVTRELYALNTAIDELILDNQISCKKFIRVNNQMWKSWLFSVDSEGIYKGLNDKLRIEKCLAMLGIFDEGEGYQDRLDATGMLVGYFLCKDKADSALKMKGKRKVIFDDVDYDYQEAEELALMNCGYGDTDVTKMYVNELRWSKEKMLEYLTVNPNTVFVTNSPVRLGNLASRLGLPYLSEGGYFAFWVKPNRLQKYMKGV